MKTLRDRKHLWRSDICQLAYYKDIIMGPGDLFPMLNEKIPGRLIDPRSMKH